MMNKNLPIKEDINRTIAVLAKMVEKIDPQLKARLMEILNEINLRNNQTKLF